MPTAAAIFYRVDDGGGGGCGQEEAIKAVMLSVETRGIPLPLSLSLLRQGEDLVAKQTSAQSKHRLGVGMFAKPCIFCKRLQ